MTRNQQLNQLIEDLQARIDRSTKELELLKTNSDNLDILIKKKSLESRNKILNKYKEQLPKVS